MTSALPRPARRRVTPNAGSAAMARVDAALAARDLEAMGPFAESFAEVSHPTGATYGRDATLRSIDRFLRLPGATTRHELLATLGDTLWLFRRWMSAAAAGRESFDVGAYEKEEVGVNEIDAGGAHLRNEIFAADRLGEAIALLYARHAELLADGPARRRATATAGAVAAMVAPPDLQRYASALSTSVEFEDHRTVGFAPGQGADKLLRGFRSLLDLATDVRTRVDDVLCLEPDALLLRWTTSGTDRTSGGAFESAFFLLWVFGPDGLIVHDETFDVEREEDALARYDELVRPRAAPGARRVRPNAAGELVARFADAFAAGDEDTVGAQFASTLEVVDHPNGATYGRDGHLASVQQLRRARDPLLRFEPIAALGQQLLLVRRRIHASGSGGDRFDVGAYEREELVLFEVDIAVAGRCTRIEVFAADHLSEAFVSLYARYAATLAHGAERDRALATARTLATAVRPPDLEAWCATIADSFELVDHRVLGVGTLRGGEAMRKNYRAMFELEERLAVGVADVLAARPDALLARLGNSGVARVSGGVYERRFLQLCVFDRDGRIGHMEYFDDQRDDEALARFDALTTRAPAARPMVVRRVRENAATGAIARFGEVVAARDAEALAEMVTERLDFVHHPTATTYGRRGMLKTWHSLFRAERLTWSHRSLASLGDSLALDRHVVRAEGFAEEHLRPVGSIELEEIGVWEMDGRGRPLHLEVFAPDRLGDAIARLYERHAELLPDGPARAAASATARSFAVMRLPSDPARIATACAESFRCVDHRVSGTWNAPGLAEALEHHRLQEERTTALVTRDDDVLALAPQAVLLRRACCGTQRASGRTFENLLLVLLVFGADGRHTSAEVWAPERAADALARFDEVASGDALDLPDSNGDGRAAIELNAASRTRARANEAFLARDWDAMRALASARMTYEDRRRWSQMSGGVEMWVHSCRTVQTADGVEFHDTVLGTVGASIEVRRRVITGSGPEGAAFESEMLLLTEVDDEGTLVASINFDLEERAEAFREARQRRLAGDATGRGAPQRFANAATASAAPVIRCLIAHDWDGFRQLLAEDFRMSDRRRVVQLELDREQYVAFTREVADGRTVRNRWEMVATRGERLAVTRSIYEFEDADVGPSEIAFLLLMEIDEHGRIVGNVRWDADDLDAARAELDRRWAAGDGAERGLEVKWLTDYERCFTSHDWAGMAEIWAADLVAHNHRLVSWGTVHGPADLIATLQAQMELAPDTRARLDHIRTCAGGMLLDYTWHGTRDGGAFEVVSTAVVELDASGRARRFDVWEAEQLEQARARFAELGRNAPHDPRAAIARGNAATALADRWQLFDADVETDWDELRASCAPEILFEDRQGFAHVRGDRELMVASLRARAASGAQPIREVIALAGDRVAVTRLLWSGGPSDGRFEIEYLGVTEVDASGRLTATILFGADDERAALREAWARWAAIEPDVAATVALVADLGDAWSARDRARIRALCAEDLAYADHRRAGIGRLVGSDAFVASLDALWQLAPATEVEFGRSWPACARHGGVTVVRRFGTLPDGGPFESEYLQLFVHAHGRATHLELFELDEIDRSLARLGALRPDPLHIPPNAATRLVDRQITLGTAGDWAAVAALHSPDLVFDDRRPGLRTTTGGEAYLAGLRWGIPHTKLSYTLLATAGDRLELRRNRFTRTEGATLVFEIETLALAEIDADGRLAAVVLFDPADRAAAHEALFERWVASDPRPIPPAVVEYRRAWNGHDFGRLGTLMTDDFVCDDHRFAGMGRIDGGAAYAASVAAYAELSPDLRIDDLYQVVVEPWGRVAVSKTWGTNREGGVFETVSVMVSLFPDGRPARLELFEPADLDRALARFAELGAKRAQ